MNGSRPITIVGGGLAGLTLGIGLRQRNIPVTVWEAGRYPRHRVCGEFISGRGQAVLLRLGLMESLRQAGVIFSNTAQFFLGNASSPVRRLLSPALCLSRFDLDALLAECFRSLGGELRENSRWNGNQATDGIVLANGRRMRPNEDGWRWFGLKVHARQAQLGADLEMHCSHYGYVGLSRLPRGEVNVCGLFRARPGMAPPSPNELLHGLAGTPLQARLANAVFDETSFCSVAGLSLRPQRAADAAECRLGDALTLIPPLTGNGMSMAFEAAELALDPISAYSRGQLGWVATRTAIARACDTAFRQRLFWARWLQALMFLPAAQGSLGRSLLNWDALWRLFFNCTR
ncbi:MAG TPA: NAD(P)-binding protein [Verrucomicrobiae bacterium]|nr:NAD(P)-binding protein [Verrucomicrobiae bacterium]